jgi:hypothetical protein
MNNAGVMGKFAEMEVSSILNDKLTWDFGLTS